MGHHTSIGTLASGIAHEVNNLLSSILTNVQLMQSKIKDGTLTMDKIMEYAGKVEEVTKHCKATIQNLLDSSRELKDTTWKINPKFRSIKVLIVDDEEHMRDSLSELLFDIGFEVVTATSGEDALKKLRENMFEIALVDIKMPGMEGVELLGRVREEYPDVSVIMITGYATADNAVEALKMGACDFLRKPYDNEELKASINRLLEKRKLEKKRK